ncbi:uncharacterized protein MELLADRAFT_95125 [Melampsora larici-populina 98AG31]|uniref:Uncharacterized protein n=1 Tax=Melampsora larici-populina (strain 98AG31 / pathotype 3-4-7) TaxID=747676 RepID=F4RC62_MELLP|nr:uncharacterized protein MELLADRAFT_95125 [Melampsora larici-populina 98AG31]EGG10004.1 hypothetical protein MELLADRAFT_95125 [Melampsora larici-populina 98AG31]
MDVSIRSDHLRSALVVTRHSWLNLKVTVATASTRPGTRDAPPPRYDHTLMNHVIGRSPAHLSPCTMSPLSLMSSINPHINPSIFTASPLSQYTPLAPSRLLSSGSRPVQRSPLKRGASKLNLSDDKDELAPIDDELSGDGLDDKPSGSGLPTPALSTTSNVPDVPNEERTFTVQFNLWQLVVPEVDPPNSRRKRTPGGPRANRVKSSKLKYSNFNPRLTIKLILWAKHTPFVIFKRLLFQACEKQLPQVSEALHRAWLADELAIQGFIHRAKQHKAKANVSITDHESFKEFIHAALSVPESTTMGFKIIHENPVKTQMALRALKAACKDTAPNSDESDKDASDASEGVIFSPLLYVSPS